MPSHVQVKKIQTKFQWRNQHLHIYTYIYILIYYIKPWWCWFIQWNWWLVRGVIPQWPNFSGQENTAGCCLTCWLPIVSYIICMYVYIYIFVICVFHFIYHLHSSITIALYLLHIFSSLLLLVNLTCCQIVGLFVSHFFTWHKTAGGRRVEKSSAQIAILRSSHGSTG